MSQRIIKRKNIVISGLFAASTNFTYDMKMEFQPDEMIVKMVALSDCSGITVAILKCNTINETLAACAVNTAYSSNITYLAKNYPMNTQWSFSLVSPVSGLNINVNVSVYIHLEFVQYQ